MSKSMSEKETLDELETISFSEKSYLNKKTTIIRINVVIVYMAAFLFIFTCFKHSNLYRIQRRNIAFSINTFLSKPVRFIKKIKKILGSMKVDLHIHTNLDPIDGKKGKNVVRYNYKEAIDKAKEKGLNAI